MLALGSQKLKFRRYLGQVLLKLLYMLLYFHRRVRKLNLESTDQLFFELLLQSHFRLLNQSVHLLEGTIDHVMAKLEHASMLLENGHFRHLTALTFVLVNFLEWISLP